MIKIRPGGVCVCGGEGGGGLGLMALAPSNKGLATFSSTICKCKTG